MLTKTLQDFTIYGLLLLQAASGLSNYNRFNAACGVRPPQRQPRIESEIDAGQDQIAEAAPPVVEENYQRKPKIISGELTKEGNFPWQVSLELLHPSLGFLGHWCGGVLIDQNWIISAAHCVHNELFNLPLPALWTVVLGDHNRKIESGDEQRVSVEKIIIHQKYHNFQHDLVLMRLSRPANIDRDSYIRKICLPFITNHQSHGEEQSSTSDEYNPLYADDLNLQFPESNYLRKIRWAPSNTTLNLKEIISNRVINLMTARKDRKLVNRRRNDKFFQAKNHFDRKTDTGYDYLFKKSTPPAFEPPNTETIKSGEEYSYVDCVVTGWGKSTFTGDLTDVLLKSRVPIHDNSRCHSMYGDFVKIHKGHICAGRLDGRGNTCVGDSGGPLQCRLSKTSPWILVGITSFGSGCALRGFPDVFTRISYYMKWIAETISREDRNQEYRY